MIHATVSGFDWDDGNRRKCEKHGVSVAEIEELYAGTVMILPDHGHSQEEERFRAIATNKQGRHVFVVFTVREHHGRRYIRPISARYMHRKEVARHEKDNPDLQER